jgi:hypothetical protein
MYRVSFILGDRVFIEMKCTKQSAIGCIFQCHSPEMKCTKPSYRCLHLRRNTLEKNTIYSCTRTLIGQKTFRIYVQRTKLFFLANTLGWLQEYKYDYDLHFYSANLHVDLIKCALHQEYAYLITYLGPVHMTPLTGTSRLPMISPPIYFPIKFCIVFI